MLQPGQVLQGRYSIERALGQGGTSVVYRAVGLQLKGRIVAVKEMPMPVEDASTWIQTLLQVQQEAGMLAPLRHPGLVEVIEYFTVNQTFYMVMEFISGTTLEGALNSSRDLPPLGQVIDWMDQVCDVLVYLHGQTPPILFRDLKPPNIMLDGKGRVRLIDFGIARLLIPKSETNALIKGAGTPGFAPPEQFGAHGQTTDTRSDIYALGATLHTMFTRTVPPTVLERMSYASNLQPCSSLNPEVPPALDQVVFKMMALNKEERYPTVAEARQAMDLAFRGQTPVPIVRVEPRVPVLVPIVPVESIKEVPKEMERRSPEFCPGCGAVPGPAETSCSLCGEFFRNVAMQATPDRTMYDVPPLMPPPAAPPMQASPVRQGATLVPRRSPDARLTDDTSHVRPGGSSEIFGAQPVPTTIGSYKIVNLLAKGGMASVYVAEFPGAEGRYALKTCTVSDAQTLARFEREIIICLKLRHRNICQVVDWGYTANKTPYLVMELLEGQVFGEFIDKNAPVALEVARPLLVQMLEGMECIHSAGVVHRDLKPGNVFVTNEGVLKIMDFGVARRDGLTSLTMTGTAVGTALYMAPEQLADAKHVDLRADLFNVGLLGFFMLTRHHPFDEPSLAQLMLRMVRGSATPLSKLRPDLPPEVQVWIERLLHQDPTKRFQTAREAIKAINF